MNFDHFDVDIERDDFSMAILTELRNLFEDGSKFSYLAKSTSCYLLPLTFLAFKDWEIDSTVSVISIRPSANTVETIYLKWITGNNSWKFIAGSPLPDDYRLVWMETPLGYLQDINFNSEEWASREDFAQYVCQELCSLATGARVLRRKQLERSDVELLDGSEFEGIPAGFTVLEDSVYFRLGLA